jgi:hypothetical protein
MNFDMVHLLFRIRIRIQIHNLKLRIRIRIWILQKVSDPYGSGFGSGSKTVGITTERSVEYPDPYWIRIRIGSGFNNCGPDPY